MQIAQVAVLQKMLTSLRAGTSSSRIHLTPNRNPGALQRVHIYSSDCFLYVPAHPSFPPSNLQHFQRDILPPQLTAWGEDTAQNQDSADTSFAVGFPRPWCLLTASGSGSRCQGIQTALGLSPDMALHVTMIELPNSGFVTN